MSFKVSLSMILMVLCSLAAVTGEKEAPKKKAPLKDQVSTTNHKVTINGAEVSYQVNTGTLVLRKEDGTARASVFYMAYTRADLKGASASRPLTFSFNGGPGSSSVWLHLGVLGPKRVLMDDMGNPTPPPYKLVDNAYSILDKTDLVFIDPVTTGYSRPADEKQNDQFHGFSEDVSSVADFIRLYITRNQRWDSPKFLVGESYGTTRAAGLAGRLQNDMGIYLNGIMLISSILNFQTARFQVGNDLPYILFFPTYTATAWYHGKLDDELQNLRATLDQAEAFARGAYADALFKGSSLSAEELRNIAVQAARLTGLSSDYVERTNLRIGIGRFVKELRRDERITVGRLDSRFTSSDRDAAGEYYEYDPSYAAIQGPYTATMNHYVNQELNFKSDLPYEILTGRVHPWSYADFENRYVDVSETLREAITRNPALKVYVANGYYDLATPYFATEYTFNHLHLSDELSKNITMGYYESGHMMYIHKPSLEQMKRELDVFLDQALQD